MVKIERIEMLGLRLVLGILLILVVPSCVERPPSEQPPSAEEVSITILTDVYVLPVAELQTTKTYPDVIVMENEYIKISVVPNRGRLIFDYLFKPTGNSQFYVNTSPSPMKTPADYVVEFGGYYLSLPWNPRDRQPYDLEYELIKKGPDTAEVYVWGEDPINLAFVEAWITVKQNSSLVQMKIRISNRTEKDMTIKFGDYAVIAPGGELTDNSTFIIPTSEVTIDQSKDAWMGAKGEVVPWPPVWTKWGDFNHFGSFHVQIDRMSAPFAAIINYDTGDTLVKLWEPADFFDGLRVWSWGKDYRDVRAATPTANFENYTENISLPAGGSIDLFTYFYALKDMQNIGMANPTFAGWLAADKQIYKIAEDQLNVRSQVGSSEDYENVNLVIALTDLDGNILTQIAAEQVATISPAESYSGAWTVGLQDIKVEPGEYILKLELLDAHDVLVFTVESASIVIQ